MDDTLDITGLDHAELLAALGTESRDEHERLRDAVVEAAIEERRAYDSWHGGVSAAETAAWRRWHTAHDRLGAALYDLKALEREQVPR